MDVDLTDEYFRMRGNGTAVFGVQTENRKRRIEIDQIDILNTNRHAEKAHEDGTRQPVQPDDFGVRQPHSAGGRW